MEQELPQGWAWTTLGDVADIGSGATPKTKVAEYWGDEVAWVTPDDLSRNKATKFIGSGRRSLSTLGYESCSARTFPSGSVVFSSRAPIGHIAITSGPVATNQGCKTAVPRPLIDSRFLYWLLKYVTPEIESRASGSTFKEISASGFAATQIPLPPLPEQHRIVEALEDHLSRLDAAELTLVSAARRAELLISRLVDHTVLGVATSTPISGAPASDLKGKHNRFDYQGLPSLPQGWSWKLAADLCKSINSGSTPKSEFMQQGQGEIPFLKVYNIDPAGRVDFTKNPTFVSRDTHYGQLKRSIALPGDVVTNIVGPPLGKSAVVPDSYPEWNTNQAIVSFRAGDSIHPSWLALCLRSPFIIHLLKGTAKATAGQFNIALSTCRELPLPVPPLLRTQEVLLEELDAAIRALEHANIAQRTSRSRSTTLRSALLRSAFNGRLVDQDPTDEPAGVALERTRNHQPAAPPRRRRKAAAK